MKTKRIIFMGSFDPFHKGHLAVVSLIRDIENIYGGGPNWLHIIPAYKNPNKSVPMFDYDERLVIIERSVYNEEFGKSVEESNIIVDNIEHEEAKYTRKDEPVYSLHVLKRFREKYPDDIMIWALTEETYAELKDNKWYESKVCLFIPDAIEILKTKHIPNIHSEQIREAIFVMGLKNKFLVENLHPNVIKQISCRKFASKCNT